MRHLTLLLSALFLVVPSLSACTKRPATTPDVAISPRAAMSPPSTAPTDAGPGAKQRPLTPDTRAPSGQVGAATSSWRGVDEHWPSEPGTLGRISPSEFSANADLLDIRFALDRYDISADAARILDANAVWLKAHTRGLLLIEGHTDKRGTSAYNFTLGDRRATAAKNYLVSRGVHAARITTISYGKEQPVCREGNEPCWAKNRRAHFLVKEK